MFDLVTFTKSLRGIGAAEDVETFEMLDALYSQPSRFYHDKTHVTECLSQFQKYRVHAQRPFEIEIAIWFHDAIYDTTAADNEEKSAELAEQRLALLKPDVDVISRVVDMILATKTHEVSTSDSELMVDVDLGILGTPGDVFETYDQNIRKEYHWVPKEVYIPGRVKVLQSFLDREVIYHTTQIRHEYDRQARRNLSKKITELSHIY